MALSGIITFGLLLVLIDCLNGQNAHPSPVLTKAKGRTARIQCKVDSSTLQSNALHWYRLKDQALQRLMYFEAGSKKGKIDPGVPSRYSGSVSGDVVTLTVSTLEYSDAGSYYCALWSGDNTVLTARGNHGKNLLSASKLLLQQMQQQGRHSTPFNCDVAFCCQYFINTFYILNVQNV